LDLPLKGCGTKQVGWKQSSGTWWRGHCERLLGSFGDIVIILLGFLGYIMNVLFG
jgi:hypothetical protein